MSDPTNDPMFEIGTEENYKRAVANTENGGDCDMKVGASWLRQLIEDYWNVCNLAVELGERDE